LSIETEIKIPVADFREFRRQADALGGVRVSGRHFEDNYIFDFDDARIRRGHCFVRVRSGGGKCFLTYKGPPKPEGPFKTREELETEVGSASIAKEILEKLGMKVLFRYQKFREEYRVLSRGPSGDAVCLSLDETPIGNYAEFEGSEEGIRELTGHMGFNELSFLRASYYFLYIEYCRERGISPGDMVFPGTGNETEI
jgi:adenylate cyclase, class 2